MQKIIWMSDLHFLSEGHVAGHDPRVRLEAAIGYINAHHGDAELCVISGDLVNQGTLADYQALRRRLDQLSIPYLPMVGNHDDRACLRQTLPVPEGCMERFVQYALPTKDVFILALDTLKEGCDEGEFCSDRRRWLERTLKEAKDRPVLAFLHHPPMDLGLPMQDEIKMEEGDAFLDLLNRAGNVSQLCIGHVHRSVSGVVCGMPFTTMRSVLYQPPPPVPAWDWDSVVPAREDPSLGVILIDGSQITIQNEIFCAYELGTKDG